MSVSTLGLKDRAALILYFSYWQQIPVSLSLSTFCCSCCVSVALTETLQSGHKYLVPQTL